jgi:methionyl-tRNA formyltransferase
MIIQVLVDNEYSWMVPFAKKLVDECTGNGHEAVLLHKHSEVMPGDVLCLLSCEKLFRKLELNKHNLVVHESALPKGKGWSPMTWQVLEGAKEIPVTLFEATKEVDAGLIYDQKIIKLAGHELVNELRCLQGNATIELVIGFVSNFPNNVGKEQEGDSTFYRKRAPEDSRIDITKSIESQFNLLQIVDNEKYPAFFEYNGFKYKIAISKIEGQ